MVFIIYLIAFTLLIYLNGFFKLFSDQQISKRTFALVFIAKSGAILVFFSLFMKSGIVKLDAAKFFNDAVVMNELGFKNVGEFIKMLFGMQDDSEGSYFYNTCIKLTDNWDNGVKKDFFYNDNRIIIRIHSVLNFITFGSYHVHALLACFFSYIGSLFIYKVFKEYFKGSEKLLFVSICLFPTLWLYTGGLLKEPWVIFFLGFILYQLKMIFERGLNFKYLLMILFLLFISILLKPYILFYALIYFWLYFLLNRFYVGKNKIPVFLVSIIAVSVLLNGAAYLFKNRSFTTAAIEREKEFADLAKGGIFLLDSTKFVRLDYNYDLVKRVEGKNNFFTIRKQVPFTYWEHSHQKDTLYCKTNLDTITQYSLVYDLPTAGSNVNVIGVSSNPLILAAKSLYYTTAHPFFFNAKGIMQILASVENLLLIMCLIITVMGFFINRGNNFLPVVLIIFGLSLFILIGITTPNSGAILRYRSPAAIFVIMAAIYYGNVLKNRRKKYTV